MIASCEIALRERPLDPLDEGAIAASAERDSFDNIILPSDFVQRVRRLQPYTPLRIGETVRRILKETERCEEGMAASLPG